jgi:hypothetical protein
VLSAIQITLNYHAGTPATNVSATPTIRNVQLRNINVEATKQSDLTCDGLRDSPITGITFTNVTVTGKAAKKSECSHCSIEADKATKPQPKCK